jgi:hypothetical protein
MSINCQDDYYYSWTGYALSMIAIYPFGIPMMYFYLLYTNRVEISKLKRKEEQQKDEKDDLSEDETSDDETNRKEKRIRKNGRENTKLTFRKVGNNEQQRAADLEANDCNIKQIAEEDGAAASMKPNQPPARLIALQRSNSEKRREEIMTLSPSAQRLAFLWSAYLPQYWYWEIIETTRRIFLTAVLSVCAPGSSEQTVISILVAVIYIFIYAYYKPYYADEDGALGTLGQCQIFFTYFVTLALQNSLVRSQWYTPLGIILIFFNLFVILFSFYCVVTSNKWIQKTITPHLQSGKSFLSEKLNSTNHFPVLIFSQSIQRKTTATTTQPVVTLSIDQQEDIDKDEEKVDEIAESNVVPPSSSDSMELITNGSSKITATMSKSRSLTDTDQGGGGEEEEDEEPYTPSSLRPLSIVLNNIHPTFAVDETEDSIQPETF